MKLYSGLAASLTHHGTDTIFGLVGDANLFLADSFVRDHNGTFVSAVHEKGATMMAYGYAVVSGHLGVASVTHGPGLTNAITGLVEAVKARIPMLLLCGDTATEDRYHQQDIAQRDLILPTGAGFEQVRSPNTALMDMAIAIRRAHQERRPVALNVPKDFLWADVEVERIVLPSLQSLPPRLDESSIDAAVGIIATARRPVIVAGRGGVGARSALLGLAERVGAPIATSLGGKDLFRDEPFDLGIMGTLSSALTLEIINEADCIVAFGVGLNRDTTAQGSLLAGKRVIHCDVDPYQLGRYAHADAMIIGDASDVANLMIDWLDEAEVPASLFRSEAMERNLEIARNNEVVGTSKEGARHGTIEVRAALRQIDRAVPPERIFVTDPGRHLVASWIEIHVESPQHFVFPANFGAIGMGLASAIGAGFADPNRPVLMVGGDGGFMLELGEFNSAVRHKVDLIVVICNDAAYGAEHMLLVDKGLPTTIAEFDWPELASVADALGGQGVTVRNERDLEVACKLIANRAGPILIDLKLDPYEMPEVPH